MNINKRIDLLVRLGEYFVKDDASLQSAKQKASANNPWFSIEFINLALENITKNFLQKDLLEAWVNKYDLEEEPVPPKMELTINIRSFSPILFSTNLNSRVLARLLNTTDPILGFPLKP